MDDATRARARAWLDAQIVPPAPEPPGLIDGALAIAERLCVRFEGFRAKPYRCPAGVPTIGYGTTRYLDGRSVTMDDPPITEPQAREMLRAQLARDYLPGVLRLCPGAQTPERVGALTDFAYNLGVGALGSSTLRRRVNAGQWDDVPAQLRRWVYGGGKVLPGLVARREAEAALI